MHIFTFQGDGVNFINEDDCRGVLLHLFDGLPEITLTFTSHLTHNLGAIYQEKEHAGLICNCMSHECFTGTRRAKHQDTIWRLDTNGLEQL
jgi:hypothetical protein